MIVCEYFFKPFDSRGSEEYLNRWATQVDRMGSEGWEVLDSIRRRGRSGLWTVILARPANEFREANTGDADREDPNAAGPF